MKPDLSVVVNSKDSARHIEACLASVTWADQIILLDMQSHDQTVEIAKKYHAQVYTHPSLDYVEPTRNYAISLAKNDWVLLLDADEVIPPLLATKIRELLTNTPPNVSGYLLPRKNIIFQSWVDSAGWWPDYQLRLLKKGSVIWPDKIHAQPKVVSGSIEKLPAKESFAVHHFNYQTINDYLEKLIRYTNLEAKQRPDLKEVDSRSMLSAFGNELLRRIFAQQGIKSGRHGLALSMLQGFYELLTVLRAWENQGFKDSKQDQAQIINQLQVFNQDLSWWIAHYQVTKSTGLRQLYWKTRRTICKILS